MCAQGGAPILCQFPKFYGASLAGLQTKFTQVIQASTPAKIVAGWWETEMWGKMGQK